jgi:flagellar export protein FliJ
MKKFKFTLQSVHNVRELREERELMVLSQLNIEAERASEKLAAVETAIIEAVENYNRKFRIGEQVNVTEMELGSRHISALEMQKAAAREELLRRRSACQQQIGVVTRAAQEVKVTGKLRESQMAAYRLSAAQHEQNSIDEMVTIGFARNAGESR